MSYPLLQFVASPDVGATVRFDFNTGTTGVDGSTEVLQDGFSLGSPTLQGDPDGIGSEYGFRELSIPLRINGTTTSAPAKFATLARELGRQTNWLRFQSTATSTPYWFKTYRSAPEPLDWEQFRNLPAATVAKWYVPLKLDAHAFAYGATVVHPTVTLANDPAAGTNPMWFKLPAIQGDAPVPLVVDVKPTVGAWDAGSLMLMATTPSLQATPYAQEYPFFKDFGTGDGATTYNGTSPVVTAAAWSGGSARNITFDSAPTNLYQRLSVSVSFAAGSYRLMARVSPSDTASAFQLQATAIFSSSDVVTMPAAAVGPRWVDLGLVRVPFGQPNVSPAANIGTFTTILSIMAARTAGSGTLRFDQIAAVPVSLAQDSESSTMVASFPSGGPNTSNWAHIDGQAETASLVSGNSLAFHIYQTTDRAIKGGYPMGYPGRDNSLMLFQQTGEPATRADDLTQSATVVVSYQPRYLYLAA